MNETSKVQSFVYVVVMNLPLSSIKISGDRGRCVDEVLEGLSIR